MSCTLRPPTPSVIDQSDHRTGDDVVIRHPNHRYAIHCSLITSRTLSHDCEPQRNASKHWRRHLQFKRMLARSNTFEPLWLCVWNLLAWMHNIGMKTLAEYE